MRERGGFTKKGLYSIFTNMSIWLFDKVTCFLIRHEFHNVNRHLCEMFPELLVKNAEKILKEIGFDSLDM